MLRKLIIWTLAILLIISMLPLFAFAETSIPKSEPAIQSEAGFLIDVKSGQVLYAKNEHEKLYPASITKIMTAIIALERGKLDDQVKTSRLAREQEGNRVYLEEGESQSLENLLYGMMLNSGNDAAIAIAEHIAGSVEAFADLMNKKAQELGAKNTHFVNPNGLHHPEHYTTAHDITLISKYAMQNAKFREIVNTQERPWNGEKWQSLLVNINYMLYNYEGVNGVKTGFTDEAQQTLVFSAVRGDRELLGSVMKAQTKMAARLDATALLDYGFQQFETRKLVESNQSITTLKYNDELQTEVKAKNDFYYTFNKSKIVDVQQQVKMNSPSKPPVAAGAEVGRLEFTANNQVLGSVPLIAANEIPAPPSVFRIVSNSFKWWYTLLPVPLLFIGLIYH